MLVNFIGIYFWLFIVNKTIKGYSAERQYSLTVGIYSPLQRIWADSIQSSFEILQQSNLQQNLQISFVEYREVFEFNLDSINSLKEKLVSAPVSVIIGPYSSALLLTTEYIGVPYIVTTWPDDTINVTSQFTFFMLPHQDKVHNAVLDIARIFQWQKVAVLYSTDKRSGQDNHISYTDGLEFIASLVKLPQVLVHAWPIQHKMNDTELRQLLLNIKGHEIYTIVAVSYNSLLESIMSNALKLSMMSARYSWLILNLNSCAVNYQQYMYTDVNYTIFQLTRESVADVELKCPSDHVFIDALADDSLNAVIRAASEFSAVNNFTNHKCTTSSQCSHVVKSHEIIQHLKQVSFNGSTGLVAFNEFHQRENVSLGLMSLSARGLTTEGRWNEFYNSPKERLDLKPSRSSQQSKPHPLEKELIKIVTIIDAPFVKLKQSEDRRELRGNDRFEGFLIDMIAEIAKKLAFKYELYEVPDGKYGSVNESGQWNGMIKELQLGNAAMCLGAISITSEREEAIDFTKPFKQKKFNLLMKKPQQKQSIYQFLWPLHLHVWLLALLSIVVVGFLLYILDRISPNSRDSEMRFHVMESLWFVYASFVGAGTDLQPSTISGRLLSGTWWFFALILVSSYTANLAAFLTVTKIDTPINSVADLAGQTKIKYGTVKNTYANSFFKKSTAEVFKNMWTFMGSLCPDCMVSNSSAGIEKVQKGDYAFIWDEPINKYISMTYCDTMPVGESFDEKGYGIGVPSDASYRDRISMAILQLSEESVILQLEKKWWDSGHCEDFKDTSTSTKELNLESVGGVFVVVAAGAALALIVAVFELAWKTKCGKKPLGRDDIQRSFHRGGSSTIALRSSMYHNGPSDSSYHKESSL